MHTPDHLMFRRKILFIVISPVIFYLSLEFIFLLVQGFFLANEKINIDSFNKPCAKFDPVAGYKWSCSDCRVIRIRNSEVVFDNTFRTNKSGYVSGILIAKHLQTFIAS